mgnify:CR=1 FL=1
MAIVSYVVEQDVLSSGHLTMIAPGCGPRETEGQLPAPGRTS